VARLEPRQEIQFCSAVDGVRIAYAAVGSGPPLVKSANWLNHLEYDWRSPIWSHLLRGLAEQHRLIRYDERGNGLSDWDVQDISFDAFVRDLETVVDAAGLERFHLFGVSQGVAASIAYAVRHPDRVNRLVLYGGFVRGRARRTDEEKVQFDALMTLVRHGWGKDNPAFRQIWTSIFIPGGTPEQMQWFNDLQRISTSPENAARIMQATAEIDVGDLLHEVRVPTLVLHCRDDAAQPFEESRKIAAAIRGARLVALEGKNHLILEHEPAWARFRNEIEAFLVE
jgi:pimeloyl-ACP methyl ester carboxylesterase